MPNSFYRKEQKFHLQKIFVRKFFQFILKTMSHSPPKVLPWLLTEATRSCMLIDIQQNVGKFRFLYMISFISNIWLYFSKISALIYRSEERLSCICDFVDFRFFFTKNFGQFHQLNITKWTSKWTFCLFVLGLSTVLNTNLISISMYVGSLLKTVGRLRNLDNI